MHGGATGRATEAARSQERAAGARVGLLFEQHGRMVYALCRMILRSAEDAEDATQQTFLRAHRNLCSGTDVAQPAAWLATIARHECYRRAGARRLESVPLEEAESTSEDAATVVDRRAEIEALCLALSELPPAQRDAVVLREFYGLSYREVAAALGVSGPAVESLLFKSRRRLQEKLRPVRAASSAVMLPLALRDALAGAIPGFLGGSAGAEAAAGGAVVAKLAAAPLAAKLAAVVVAVGAGTVVGASGPHRPPLMPEPVEAAIAAPTAQAPRSVPEPVARPIARETAKSGPEAPRPQVVATDDVDEQRDDPAGSHERGGDDETEDDRDERPDDDRDAGTDGADEAREDDGEDDEAEAPTQSTSVVAVAEREDEDESEYQERSVDADEDEDEDREDDEEGDERRSSSGAEEDEAAEDAEDAERD